MWARLRAVPRAVRKLQQTTFNASPLPLMTIPGQMQKRRLNIHEYQSMQLFKEYGLGIPPFMVASSPQEAEEKAHSMVTCESTNAKDFVVKAQILAGGRGKGTWDTGFQGGVHLANSVLEVRSLAAKMLNNRLITKQSGELGKPCNQVMICQRMFIRREAYFAILLDRETCGPMLVGSPAGGKDIEEVADENPDLIYKLPVDIMVGLEPDLLRQFAEHLGFVGETATEAMDAMERLYKLFLESDCVQVEINPMAETHDGSVMCIDGKLNFDDNASFRQSDIFELKDDTQKDKREVQGEANNLNYIGLEGNIGCLVNGAGLAMATMDAIQLFGGSPANFLDMGGGATQSQVTEAFRLLSDDDTVKAILVNIFGGILKCDIIALGIIAAAEELDLTKPIVIRLAGTNVDAARKIIDDSGLRMLNAKDLEDAAKKAVSVADIVALSEQARLSVSFEMPI